MSGLLAFIILFGVLVFIHELGHFIMAKYFKVGVEKFALGYGPKVVGKKIGETEYLIAAFPLGGYVKMVGDDPEDEATVLDSGAELSADSFLAKPAWQRILIVLMGPIANLLLPLILFTGLFMFGQPYLSNEVGHVSADSPAAEAGLLPGDRIVAIDAQPVKKWSQLAKIIKESAAKPLQLTVERQQTTTQLQVTPKTTDGLNPFGETIQVGSIGINPQSFALHLHIPDTNSTAAQAGLQSGDLLVAVDEVAVRYPWQIRERLQQSQAKQVTLAVQRGEQQKDVFLQKSLLLANSGEMTLHLAGIFLQELVINQIMEESIAADKGIQHHDIMIAVNDKPLLSWFSFQEIVQNNQGEALNLTILREGQLRPIDIRPRMVEQTEELTGQTFRQRMLGVTTKGEIRSDTILTERVLNPIRAFAMSFERCFEITRLTVIGFGKLISGKISSKSLGGPILIYQLAGRSWRSGFHSFMNMLVLISITLGVLNLLPIPVLDGGHIMFYTAELIMGRPVKARTRQLAQQVGIILLLGLMIFAFYNDLTRIGWLNWLQGVFS